MLRVLTVFGTRPEAIKLAPVILALQERQDQVVSRVCATGQHRQMLDQVLTLFDIEPDIDLDLMQANQALSGLAARILTAIDDVIVAERPDVVLIQGDTTTVAAVAMAAFHRHVLVGHVEAGLRSGDLHSPFPEEMNRRVCSLLTTLHFAPTERARQALLAESIAEDRVFVTGNTVIDALHEVLTRPAPPFVNELIARAEALTSGQQTRLILVTAHRRENFGAPLEQICAGLRSLVERNPDIVVCYPVHLNPNVREIVYATLADIDRVMLIEPAEYDIMVHLMNAAHIVLTDSGGIQEEAPALGKPVLVLRTETERPEAIEAEAAKLVGPDARRIVEETERLLKDRAAYQQMARAVSPYGDGHASERILSALFNYCNAKGLGNTNL